MQVASLNEIGFENLASKKSPILVVVAASTGDGDAPDNAAKFYATMRYSPCQKPFQPPHSLFAISFQILSPVSRNIFPCKEDAIALFISEVAHFSGIGQLILESH